MDKTFASTQAVVQAASKNKTSPTQTTMTEKAATIEKDHRMDTSFREALPCPDSTTFCQLPWLGITRFSGEDAGDFLNRQFTNDLKTIDSRHSKYTAYCNPKGRVIALGQVFVFGGDYFFSLESKLSEAVRKRLSIFVLRSRVNLTDTTFKCIGIMGTRSEEVVRKHFGYAPTQAHGQWCTKHHVVIRVAGNGCPRFEIYTDEAHFTALQDTLLQDAQPAEPKLWRAHGLCNGYPVINEASTERFLPQSLNLDWLGAVSFSKGCFPGQEIVARIHYRGKAKQRACLVRSAEHQEMPPGSKVFVHKWHPEQPCGEIIDSCPAPTGDAWLGLAALRVSDAATGTLGSVEGSALEIRPIPRPAETED